MTYVKERNNRSTKNITGRSVIFINNLQYNMNVHENRTAE
jgi:hypothetical protein